MECPHLEKAVQIDVGLIQRLKRDFQQSQWLCSGMLHNLEVVLHPTQVFIVQCLCTWRQLIHFQYLSEI